MPSNLNSLALSTEEKLRIAMTVSCTDVNSITKHENAGAIIEEPEGPVQIMHNGLKIIKDCYYGPWMTQIIQTLKGHHEPQEEYAFFQLLKHLKENLSPWESPTMLELGSFWAYYSMWFLTDFRNGRTFCVEPDPEYLNVGKLNFLRNNLKGTFLNAQVSLETKDDSFFTCESTGQSIVVPALDFPSIVTTTGVDNFDIVLVDIQGAEIPLLERLNIVLQKTQIRFMVISTHDFAITGSPITHQMALDLLVENGAQIILEHSVSESFSGDGFILASFFESDRDFKVQVSYNRSKNSLFGEWEPRFAAALEDKSVEISILTAKVQTLENAKDSTSRISRSEDLLEIDKLQKSLEAVLNSNSWKLTEPLRKLMLLIRPRF